MKIQFQKEAHNWILKQSSLYQWFLTVTLDTWPGLN